MQINGDAKLIATAYVKARGEMSATVIKDAKGNFGRYATLAALVEATTATLAKHGLAIIQEASTNDEGISVTTYMLHESGTLLDFGTLTMPLTDRKPQAVGSVLTYCRRYALAAVCGLAPDDDDGQAAQDTYRPTAQTRPNAPVNTAKVQASTPDPKDAPSPTMTIDTPYYVRDWNQLAGKEYDLVKWVRDLHEGSDGPCTLKQYQYLSGVIDQITGNHHSYALTLLCQTEISSANMVGAKVAKNLFDLLSPIVKNENGDKVDNPAYRPDIAEMLARITKQLAPVAA